MNTYDSTIIKKMLQIILNEQKDIPNYHEIILIHDELIKHEVEKNYKGNTSENILQPIINIVRILKKITPNYQHHIDTGIQNITMLNSLSFSKNFNKSIFYNCVKYSLHCEIGIHQELGPQYENIIEKHTEKVIAFRLFMYIMCMHEPYTPLNIILHDLLQNTEKK